MRTEFRIVSRIAEGHDFYEGVRAALIDKDGEPQLAARDASTKSTRRRSSGISQTLGAAELRAA